MSYTANYNDLYKTLQAFEQFLYLLHEISKPVHILCLDTTKFTISRYIVVKDMGRNGFITNHWRTAMYGPSLIHGNTSLSLKLAFEVQCQVNF